MRLKSVANAPVMKCLHQDEAFLLSQFEHLPRLACRVRRRLLEQHMFARLECFHRPLVVKPVREWVVNNIHLGVIKQALVVAMNLWNLPLLSERGCASLVSGSDSVDLNLGMGECRGKKCIRRYGSCP